MLHFRFIRAALCASGQLCQPDTYKTTRLLRKFRIYDFSFRKSYEADFAVCRRFGETADQLKSFAASCCFLIQGRVLTPEGPAGPEFRKPDGDIGAIRVGGWIFRALFRGVSPVSVDLMNCGGIE